MSVDSNSQLGRIAITGLGMVSPFGNAAATWDGIIANRSAVRWLDHVECEGTQGANFAAPASEARLSTLSRSADFALSAARDALTSIDYSFDIDRVGSVIGTSKTDLRAVDTLFSEPQVSGDPWRALFPSSPSEEVVKQYNLRGPVLCPVAACATGLVSIIRAADLIRQGGADYVLTGSTDSSIHPGLLSSYRRLGVLANLEGSPASACRPFDQSRSGFAVGEGAAVLLLENWAIAENRQAPILAEWVDGAVGCDPSGITAVDATGETLADLVSRLLEKCCVKPSQISAICYHGTATELNDLAESRAMQRVFGKVPLGFGIKGAIGHLMGAAGAVETAVSVMALQRQVIPPTVNHRLHDPRCPNRVTGADAVSQPIEYLLKTSLGFGGHLAVGLLKRASNVSSMLE